MTRLPADDILDLLRSLVDKSLVVYEEHDGVGRYRLLETVRQYGREKLAESGEAEVVQDRAASWFLGLTEEAEPLLKGSEQALWLKRLDTEHDNLRASLAWYEDLDKQRPEKLEAGLRLSGALWRFWSVRGYFSEGREWLGRALERTQGGAEGKETSAVRAKALHGAGNLAFQQADYAVAQVLHEESLTIRRQFGDQGGIAASLNSLGLIAAGQGDYTVARSLYEQSLTIRRRLEDQRGIAYSLNNLGDIAYGQGDYAEARSLYEESLKIQRRLEDQAGIAYSLSCLGNVAFRQANYVEAPTLYERSLTIQRRLGDKRGIAASLDNLGSIAYEQGDSVLARTLLEESLTILRQLGDQKGIIYSLEGMARLAQGPNQLPQAARLWGAAASLRETIGILPHVVQEEVEKQAASVREALGEEAFAVAFAAGCAMTLDEAVEFALGTTMP